ncbi:MAG TPA: ArsC/Spx/MgsR family protein [Rhizomicrobium sp.]
MQQFAWHTGDHTCQGVAPVVIEYLKTPLTRNELATIVKKLRLPLRAVIRTKETIYDELGLESAGDDALLDAVAAHPILLSRPIVVTPKGARLCRPPELVRDLL